jgi:hypothetical protein
LFCGALTNIPWSVSHRPLAGSPQNIYSQSPFLEIKQCRKTAIAIFARTHHILAARIFLPDIINQNACRYLLQKPLIN